MFNWDESIDLNWSGLKACQCGKRWASVRKRNNILLRNKELQVFSDNIIWDFQKCIETLSLLTLGTRLRMIIEFLRWFLVRPPCWINSDYKAYGSKTCFDLHETVENSIAMCPKPTWLTHNLFWIELAIYTLRWSTSIFWIVSGLMASITEPCNLPRSDGFKPPIKSNKTLVRHFRWTLQNYNILNSLIK
jgi:hypothetical protein